MLGTSRALAFFSQINMLLAISTLCCIFEELTLAGQTMISSSKIQRYAENACKNGMYEMTKKIAQKYFKIDFRTCSILPKILK